MVIHRDGQSVWNGVDDTFIQYVTNSELNEETRTDHCRLIHTAIIMILGLFMQLLIKMLFMIY